MKEEKKDFSIRSNICMVYFVESFRIIFNGVRRVGGVE